MDKNGWMDDDDTFWDSELYSGRVKEADIKREAESPPPKISALSYTIPKALSSLLSQAILVRCRNHSPGGSPKSLTGDNAQDFLLPPAQGEISSFLVTVAWGGGKGNGRGAPAARCTPTTEPSPILAVLCKLLGLVFSFVKWV